MLGLEVLLLPFLLHLVNIICILFKEKEIKILIHFFSEGGSMSDSSASFKGRNTSINDEMLDKLEEHIKQSDENELKEAAIELNKFAQQVAKKF